MPRKFRIGRLRKNYGREEQKESLPSSSNESSETSSQSSSLTGSSVLFEESHPIVDDITSACGGSPVSTNCDTEAVPDSEQSSSINSSSVTATDDEGIRVLESSPVIQLDEGIVDSSLEALTSHLQLPSDQWVIQRQTDSMAICKMSILSGSSALVITHCIIINSDYSWILCVHRNQVHKARCPALSNVPEKVV